jgi:hypothetical protein
MRLIKWTLATWILAIVAISFALLIGRSQPLPESIRRLHLTDCELPCWIGIVPGQTTIAEAKERIVTVFGNNVEYDLVLEEGSYADQSMVTFHIKDKKLLYGVAGGVFSAVATNDLSAKVDFFNISFQEILGGDRFLFADLYPILGSPQKAGHKIYGSELAVMSFSGGRLRVGLRYQPCGQISFYSDALVLLVAPLEEDFEDQYYLTPWKGFERCYKPN